jgi:hypothetical protein
MSNVQTRTLWEGDHVRAEAMFGGKALERPIYFKWNATGWYVSIEQAEAIAAELTTAVAAARRAAQP